MPRGTFSEATVEVPGRVRSSRRLRDMLVPAVIDSGRVASEAAAAHGVSWWLVQRALNMAAPKLPDVDTLRPDGRGCWASTSTGFGPSGSSRTRQSVPENASNPQMSTIVGLDTGQVLGVVDGRDHTGVGEWLLARPLEWRLGVQVVAIDPSAAFRKALRTWLPPAAVSVDAFHLVLLGNNLLTEARQRLTQETEGRRGRTADPVWANRRLLLRARETLSDRGCNRLKHVFDTDDTAGKMQKARNVKEQLRTLLRTGSLEDAAAAKRRLQELVGIAARPKTHRLWRTVCRWSNDIEVLIVAGATTAKVEANNSAIKQLKRTGRAFVKSRNSNRRIMLRSAARTAASTLIAYCKSPRPKRALLVDETHRSGTTGKVGRPGTLAGVTGQEDLFSDGSEVQSSPDTTTGRPGTAAIDYSCHYRR